MKRNYWFTEQERKLIFTLLQTPQSDDFVHRFGASTLFDLRKRMADAIPDGEAKPLWELSPFTEQDRTNMKEVQEEEIRDCIKELAADRLSRIDDHVELVSFADEDPSVTAQLLHDIEHELPISTQYEVQLAFVERMKLVSREDTEHGIYILHLTDYGRKYLDEYKAD